MGVGVLNPLEAISWVNLGEKGISLKLKMGLGMFSPVTIMLCSLRKFSTLYDHVEPGVLMKVFAWVQITISTCEIRLRSETKPDEIKEKVNLEFEIEIKDKATCG